MKVDRTVHLETALNRIIARLTRRFNEQVDATVIEATVRRCAEEFAGATVTEFVPVFVERRSIEQLNALAADRNPPVPSRPLAEARDDQAAPPPPPSSGSRDASPPAARANDKSEQATDAVAS